MSSKKLRTGISDESETPWNPQDLCRYCDVDKIKKRASEMVEDPENDISVDAIMETLFYDIDICQRCREEDTTDFRAYD